MEYVRPEASKMRQNDERSQRLGLWLVGTIYPESLHSDFSGVTV